MTTPNYAVVWPDYFDAVEAEIVAKGYFADLTIEANGLTYRPVFYDPVRFAQEVGDHLGRGEACYAESNAVLVAKVDREHVEAAIAWLAVRAFRGLLAEA
jgi:hypothetical protein